MKTEKIILTEIDNLKTQLKKVMTEASTLEVMIREMESSLCGVDNNRACGNEPLLPMSLDFPEMRNLLDRLSEAGILGASYALRNQSWTQRSVIVAFLSGKVQRMCMWKPFAELWHCDKGALQSAYQKHCEAALACGFGKPVELFGRNHAKRIRRICSIRSRAHLVVTCALFLCPCSPLFVSDAAACVLLRIHRSAVRPPAA